MISALPWTTSASSLNSPTSNSRKATRRLDASRRTSRRSGRAIFRGIPGNPAPAPPRRAPPRPVPRGLPVRPPPWPASRGIGPLLESAWPAPRRPSPRVLLVPPALWTPGTCPSDLGALISDFPTPLVTFPGRSTPLPGLFLSFLRGLGSAPRHDDDAPEISIASACRGDGRVPLQSQVDYPPIPGIHWGKGNLPACANDAGGSPPRGRRQ